MKPHKKVMTPEEEAASVARLACACANVRRASRVITQLYDAELRASGFTIAQFGLLGAVAKLKIATQATLGTALSVDSTTLTRNLEPLLESKWIEKIPGTDRRERYLQLTALGRKQLKRALPRWQRAQARLRRRLGPKDWDRLQALLAKAVEAAQRA
jgi:DNA-binding MarR family transcriptional regulator